MNIGFLDFIRGSMALWVFSGHGLSKVGVSVPIISQASIAVDVFMLISGYLMCYEFHKLETVEPLMRSSSWFRFYTRRFFRIAPLYYLALLVALVFDSQYETYMNFVLAKFPPDWLGLIGRDPSHRGLGLSPVNILVHGTFLYGLLPAYAANNILPDWSLSFEMQYYAFLPLLMILVRRFGYLLVCFPLIVICAYSTDFFGLYIIDTPKMFGLFPQPSLLVFKISCFLVGMLLAEVYVYRQSSPSRSFFYLAFALAISLYSQHWIFTSTALLVVVFVCVDGNEQARRGKLFQYLQNFFASRSVRFMAATSYGVYLFHNLLMWPIAVWLIKIGAESWLPWQRVIMLLLLTAIPVYGLAWALSIWIEKPSIVFGKKLTKLIGEGNKTDSSGF